MEHNRDVYDRYTHEYRDYTLYPPELRMLERYKKYWGHMRVLDIGIGTGRTAFTLSFICGDYVGIDYSAAMLRASELFIPESSTAVLQQCDASDLSEYYGKKFDLVLFSLNGIDSVDHLAREKILIEVSKVLRPNGIFVFSTHILNAFSTDPALPPFDLKAPIYTSYYLARALLLRLRLRWAHRNHDLNEIRTRDWAILKTGDHGFEMDIYHVNPRYQLDELERLGFEVEAVYDPYGEQVCAEESDAQWLYFFCRFSNA